jgi:hypothetical protein
VTAFSLPEFAGQKDDSLLGQHGTKHFQNQVTRILENCTKIDVFEALVGRSIQRELFAIVETKVDSGRLAPIGQRFRVNLFEKRFRFVQTRFVFLFHFEQHLQ